jgi:hypothetical protein
MQFRGSEKDAVYFWSNGYAYGTMKQTESADGNGKEVQLTVLEGELQLERFVLSCWGAVRFDSVRRISAGETMRFVVGRDAGGSSFTGSDGKQSAQADAGRSG